LLPNIAALPKRAAHRKRKRNCWIWPRDSQLSQSWTIGSRTEEKTRKRIAFAGAHSNLPLILLAKRHFFHGAAKPLSVQGRTITFEEGEVIGSGGLSVARFDERIQRKELSQ
jgi:hypothetical protein